VILLKKRFVFLYRQMHAFFMLSDNLLVLAQATEVMRQHSPPSHGIKKTAAFSFGIM